SAQRARLSRQLVLQRQEIVEHSCDVVPHLTITPKGSAQEQVLLDRNRPEESPALRHVSHALAHENLRTLVRDVLTAERDRSRRGADEAAHDTEESRFPRA